MTVMIVSDRLKIRGFIYLFFLMRTNRLCERRIDPINFRWCAFLCCEKFIVMPVQKDFYFIVNIHSCVAHVMLHNIL